MKRICLLAPVLTCASILAGCAASVVSSNQRSVVINAHPRDADGAMSLANTECDKVGRAARLVRVPAGDRLFVFDCVQ